MSSTVSALTTVRQGRTRRARWLATATAAGFLAAAAIGGGIAPAQAATPLNGGYVSLGDSYTAGPGVADQVPNTGTCARSNHNYPSLVAAAVKPTSFTDVSCSGGTTAGITGSEFGNAPQLDAVKADTKLVTLTIGGNDSGLISAVATCVALSFFDNKGKPCTTFYNWTGTDTLVKSVKESQPKIKATLIAIKKKAPGARVLILGYPNLIPDNKAKCDPTVDSSVIATGDVPWLYKLNGFVDRTWAQTAASAGVEYVSTFVLGHDACQKVGVRWIEGVQNLTDAAPLHPNGLGMRGFADLTLAKLG